MPPFPSTTVVLFTSALSLRTHRLRAGRSHRRRVQNPLLPQLRWRRNLGWCRGGPFRHRRAQAFLERGGMNGVRTFGAPKTRGNGASCGKKGKRFFHQYDAVASNGMGAVGHLNHDVKSAVKVYDTSSSTCGSSCWIGCCPWGWNTVTSRHRTDMSCGEVAGGCSWLADCIYYFATVHSAYGEYLQEGLFGEGGLWGG